jgi:hypothetical protein
MKPAGDILAFLLKLNLGTCGERNEAGEALTPPGLPAFVTDPKTFISADCVNVEKTKAKDFQPQNRPPPRQNFIPFTKNQKHNVYKPNGCVRKPKSYKIAKK